MHFPLLNISEISWTDNDLEAYLLVDEFIYTDNKVFWNTFIRDKAFCDCKGNLYVVSKQTPPTSWWRSFFKWLPNVYKIQLTFKNTRKRMELEELRQYLLARIHDLSDSEFRTNWIQFVRQAKSHEELIAGSSS